MGEYDLGLEEDCDKYGYCAPPPQDFSPVEVIIHQQYNKPNKFQHDIAIIKLDRDVQVNGGWDTYKGRGRVSTFTLLKCHRLRITGVSPLL